MRAIQVLIAVFACWAVASQPLDQIMNVHDRDGIDLNGQRPVIVDPYDYGTFDYLSRPLTSGFWTSPGPQAPTDPEEHNYTAAETLAVPGDWNSQRDDLFFYEGTVWYRRDFQAQPDPARRHFICFGGANKRVKVWFNGQELGEHAVGFTPFHVEVTDLIREGANDLTVRVNNARRFAAVPAIDVHPRCRAQL